MSPTAFPNNYSFFTLKGDPSDGQDGFDGSGLPGRVLTGDDVHRLVIQDLTFRDSSALGVGQSGGAIDLTGETGPQIFNCSFFNNHAANRGGAVHLTQEPAVDGATLPVISALGNVFGSTTNAAEGNSATIGGALSVETPGQGQNSAFTSNLFANNVAKGNGGGFDFALAPQGVENLSLNDNDVKQQGRRLGRRRPRGRRELPPPCRQRALREQLGRAGHRLSGRRPLRRRPLPQGGFPISGTTSFGATTSRSSRTTGTTAAADWRSGALTSAPRASTRASRATRWRAISPPRVRQRGRRTVLLEKWRPLAGLPRRDRGELRWAPRRRRWDLRRRSGCPYVTRAGRDHRGGQHRRDGRAVRGHRRRPPGRPDAVELDRLQQPAAGHRRLRLL